jgi:cytochrome c oxidase subunit 3
MGRVRDSLEIPLVGCFLLLGSSITITGFHHILSWPNSVVLLIFTIILGAGFIAVQLIEFSGRVPGFGDAGFYSRCLATVGLHFSHVVMGVFGLFYLFLCGGATAGYFRCTVLT